MPTLQAEWKGYVEIEFEAYCDKCGAGLCSNIATSVSRGRRMPAINITPCEYCETSAYEKGYDKGYTQCEQEHA